MAARVDERTDRIGVECIDDPIDRRTDVGAPIMFFRAFDGFLDDGELRAGLAEVSQSVGLDL
ncbi:MAG: hypothetical protein WDN29_07800 [Methylovirgula sp.]